MGKRISIPEFKSLVRMLAARDLHLLYEYALLKYDPILDFSYARSGHTKNFLFQGRGFGTLKPYRILEKGQVKTFEKIFFNDSDDLKANLNFYPNRQQLINNSRIITPGVRKIIKGEVFTIFLYEYLELHPLIKGKEYTSLKNKTLEIYKSAPDCDHADPISYTKIIFGKNRLIENKMLTSMEVAYMDQLVERVPVCFQHLDISENNVFQKNIIIDWDNSGFFPLGMDFGRLLLSYFLYNEHDFFLNYETEISSYYKQLRHSISYKDFKALCMYFFIVYYFGHLLDHAQIEKIMPFIREFQSSLDISEEKSAISKS